MAKRDTNNMRAWARIGAEQRLNQLRTEIAAIYTTFPELRRGTPPSHPAADNASDKPARRRRRRKLSAEARKRISDAQKARWAKQKARSK